MSDPFAESVGAPGHGDACLHPWLRVVCGECGCDYRADDVTDVPVCPLCGHAEIEDAA